MNPPVSLFEDTLRPVSIGTSLPGRAKVDNMSDADWMDECSEHEGLVLGRRV
jgi:hypothetical protein